MWFASWYVMPTSATHGCKAFNSAKNITSLTPYTSLQKSSQYKISILVSVWCPSETKHHAASNHLVSNLIPLFSINVLHFTKRLISIAAKSFHYLFSLFVISSITFALAMGTSAALFQNDSHLQNLSFGLIDHHLLLHIILFTPAKAFPPWNINQNMWLGMRCTSNWIITNNQA